MAKKITSEHVRFLEDNIKKLEQNFLPENFVLPGDNLISSTLHVTRAIARRLERHAVALKKEKNIKNKNFFIYLNRLSDFLFLLACKYGS